MAIDRRAPQAPPVIPPAQRAAIVIALLQEDAARSVLEKLDEQALKRVQASLEDVSLMPQEQVTQVVMEFLSSLRGTSGALIGGQVNTKELIEGIFNARFGPSEAEIEAVDDEPESTADTDSVWERVASKPAPKIAEYLGPLTPNLIARILRKLPNGLASEIISDLPETKLEPVLGVLVHAEDEDQAIDGILCRMIEMEFLNNDQVAEEEDDSYLESVGEMLSLIPSGKRDTLFAFLQREHEAKLHSIQKSLFTLEDLPDTLPREAVPVIFREVAMEEMVKYLASMQGDTQAAMDHMLSNTSSRMAEQYQDEISSAPQMAEAEVEATRRAFLSKLLELKRKGIISVAPKPTEAAEAAPAATAEAA
ncbi:MAG: FliG C-terminal domain-containing protein [Pseudomonadota bacterium]